MTREDEVEFLDFVRGTEDVVILPSRSPSENFEPIGELPPPFSTEHWLRFLFYNRAVSSNLVTRQVEGLGYYTIDALKSSVIEFLRPSLKEGTLHKGRIWAQFKHLDQDKMSMVPKEPAFVGWYETLAKWVRKNYRNFERQVYISPQAQKLLQEGVKLG